MTSERPPSDLSFCLSSPRVGQNHERRQRGTGDTYSQPTHRTGGRSSNLGHRTHYFCHTLTNVDSKNMFPNLLLNCLNSVLPNPALLSGFDSTVVFRLKSAPPPLPVKPWAAPWVEPDHRMTPHSRVLTLHRRTWLLTGHPGRL